MTRSSFKGPFIQPSLLRKINKLQLSGKNLTHYPIKTFARNSTIIDKFIGMIFNIHNGKKFITIHIKENMVGYKLGEFVNTRRFIKHAAGKITKKGIRRNVSTGKR